MKIAIVGAAGFVGQHLARRVLAEHGDLMEVNRRADAPALGPNRVVVAEDAPERERCQALRGIDAVVLLAARVHQMNETAVDPMQAHRRGNVEATMHWAVAARAAGVRRLVFVSSVKAVAEMSSRPLREDDPPHPQDAYGWSKLAAEDALRNDPRLEGLERLIVRPPLVYGPGVRANFRALMRLAASRLPLPLGCATAPRSLISVRNLVDALLACVRAAPGAGGTYFVRDDEDLSVAELITIFRATQGRPPRLVPIPQPWLRAAAFVLGRGEMIRRLFDPLQLDRSRIFRELGWQPPWPARTELQATYRGYIGAGDWDRASALAERR